MKYSDPNNINEKDWAEEVFENWDKYFNKWLLNYKDGELRKKDIINAIKRIIKYYASN